MREVIARRTGREDEGFSLMELIVAMMIITAVLFTLVAVQVSTLATTIHAKQRQQGTAVANEVMEELRAIPWATLQKGLHPNFAAAAGGDPHVSSGVLHPPADPSINETLVTTSTQVTTAPPLSGTGGTNLTVRNDPAVPGIDFFARSYVTKPDDLETGVLQLTVIVTWIEQGTEAERTTIVRSAAYNPRSGGCGDTTTQPFLGACQAMLDADAGAGGYSFSVTGLKPSSDPETPPEVDMVVPGGSVSSGSYSAAEVSASVTSNQTATTVARVVSAGSGEVNALGIAEAGWLRVENRASTDVGAANAPPPNPADVAALGAFSGNRSFTSTPPGLTVAIQPPGSLTGYARAKSAGGCLAGIPANQPCSLSETSSEGTSLSRLSLPGGSFDLLSTSGGSQRRAWTGRYSTLPGGNANVGCTGVIKDAGCVASGASRSFGTIELGTGAWQRMNNSAGPAQRLVQISGFSDAVRVEHGVDRGTVIPDVSRSGTLSYWNGSTMATLALGSNTEASITLGEVKRTIGAYEIVASGNISVQRAATLRTGGDPVCKLEGCAVTAEMPSVTVSISYTITGPDEPHTVVTGFDLGGLRATAKYKAAPDA